MKMSVIKDDLRSFRRSWVHHTGMQLATLTILSATFVVVFTFLSLATNLNNLLVSWGDRIKISVYLDEGLDPVRLRRVEEALRSMPEVAEVTYVAKEQASINFKEQMASYAPDLLEDSDFSNPFPSSYRISLKRKLVLNQDMSVLHSFVERIKKISGVEDVSYGQSWIKNYSSFVSALSAGGLIIVIVLLGGSLFVIGNSIRVSIAARRDEIEILELIGATSAMIRRPFIFEGFFMSIIAVVFSLVISYVMYVWAKSVLSSSIAFSRLSVGVQFFSWDLLLGLTALAGVLGAIGAWVSVGKINDGWSASQRKIAS